MPSLLQETARNIGCRGLIPRGSRLLAAVSGGIDSMVLLDILIRLRQRFHWEVSVAHFNHGIRGKESDADQAFVRKRAAQAGVAFYTDSGDARARAAADGISIEMAARKLRHQFLADTAVARGIGMIALGHHAGDQAELFFVRLLRGAGPQGLAGMRWQNPSPANAAVSLVRPLLKATRDAIKQYAQREKITFREDASNQDSTIIRNRIRHRLIPFLEAEFQPALAAILSRTMEIAADEQDYLGAIVQGCGNAGEGFGRWPAALQRRHLQEQLFKLGISADFSVIEKLRGKAGSILCVGKRMRLYRDTAGAVRRAGATAAGYQREAKCVILDRGRGTIVLGERKVRWSMGRGRGLVRQAGREVFDADKVGPAMVLRYWQPGDRYRPIGFSHSRKVQDMLTDQKVAAAEKRLSLVATTKSGSIFWVEHLRVAELFKVTAATTRQLTLQWTRTPKSHAAVPSRRGGRLIRGGG